MQDTVVRDALLRNAADEPPMTFTSDDMIRTGRRSRRLRHAGSVIGSALTVALVAGTAIALVSAGSRPLAKPVTLKPGTPLWTTLDTSSFCAAAAVAQVDAVGSRQTVVNPKNGYPIAIPTEPSEHAASRLSCYLMSAVPAHLPGAAFTRDPNTPADTVPLQVYPGRAFDPSQPEATSLPFFAASAVISDRNGVGQIGFAVSPAAESVAAATTNCQAPVCSVREGPHGEVVTVLSLEWETGYRLVNINVYRGQIVTFASASNGVPSVLAAGEVQAITDDSTPAIGRADLPMSVDDLIDILSAPALTLEV
jgi:hypothetical protein